MLDFTELRPPIVRHNMVHISAKQKKCAARRISQAPRTQSQRSKGQTLRVPRGSTRSRTGEGDGRITGIGSRGHGGPGVPRSAAWPAARPGESSPQAREPGTEGAGPGLSPEARERSVDAGGGRGGVRPSSVLRPSLRPPVASRAPARSPPGDPSRRHRAEAPQTLRPGRPEPSQADTQN